MRLICAPKSFPFESDTDALQVVLYGPRDREHPERASVGALVNRRFHLEKLAVDRRAWDLLSLSLSVVTADFAEPRDYSPDGWTREFDLTVAVTEPDFWMSQVSLIEAALAFLTTDRWRLRFIAGGSEYDTPRDRTLPLEESVALLSGGLDSLIGCIDLVRAGKKPLAVSQLVKGDAEKQVQFAQKLGPIKHLVLNHNATTPESQSSLSQRSRSLIFVAFGVAAATTLASYHAGGDVPLYICENGFIAVNPPLTAARIGSLSTRTAHPLFLGRIQSLLNACGLRVKLVNPYQYQTKGEMLLSCVDQALIKVLAATSTSCARFLRHGYRHCGRCMPCQIRRAAFLKWGVPDTTAYAFEDIGKSGPEHSGFDDVRSVAMAIAQVATEGLDAWLGSSLSRALLGDVSPLRDVVGRGLKELEALHKNYNVK
jgi:7-cyano-7-deazaguanine synthase in queuosine biosynthesis